MSDQVAPSPLNRIPAEVTCAADYESLARQFLAPPTYAYIAGGSSQDLTATANLDAFADCQVLPRVLRDVSHGHTEVRLHDQVLPHPILLAPVAHQRLAHPNGELDTARACAAADACLIASTLSSFRLEEIAQLAGPVRWFQLYFQPERDDTLQLVQRAEAAGFRALVVTVDAPLQVPSAQARRAGFTWPTDCIAANLVDYQTPPLSSAPGESRIFRAMSRAVSWSDLEWLRARTSLPIWVKGVMHPDDALQLQARGVAGVVVSNHGGRTVDGVPASLRMLPRVRAAVGKDFPLLFDGGIRSGTDVFKALALGADAVLVGRLQMYALSVAGALGVAHLLKLLREELEVSMALAGCASLAEIGPRCLLPPSLANGASDAARH